MKPVLALFLASLLAGCASDPMVQTDRDPAVDFRQYHSFAWKQEPPISNPLLKQRIVSAVNAELTGKGWQQVPEAQADLVLVGNVATHEDVALNYYYEGNAWAGWDLRAGGTTGMHRMEQRSYRIGTLIVDVFDAASRRAVWRATAEGTVPQTEEHQSRDALVAVHGMFRDFPAAPAKAQ